MRILRRSRAVLRQLRHDQNFFHDGYILQIGEEKPTVETFWRNPELAGIWECRYLVARDVVRHMLYKGLIVRDEKSTVEKQIWRPSPINK